MVFGTQTLFAVFKRTGGKVWKIRKLTETRKANIKAKEALVKSNVSVLKAAAASEASALAQIAKGGPPARPDPAP